MEKRHVNFSLDIISEQAYYSLSQGFHYRSCACNACRANLTENQYSSNPQVNQSQSNYLTIDSLTSNWFLSHTQNAVEAAGMNTLNDGAKISFDLETGKNGKEAAVNIQPL